MAPMFPLVVVVHADEETRVKRLIKRGMAEADARARIAAQAPEDQRRAIADVLLDNSGSQGELVERARDIWYHRVLPLAHNIRTREVVRVPPALAPYDPAWPDDARRIINRLRMACGSKALRVDHIGSTAVPGMDGKDVIDVQVTVESLDVADELAGVLTNVGYPRIEGITGDVPHDGDPALWRKRFHGAADPGRPANVPVRRLVDGQSRRAGGLPDRQAEGGGRDGLCRCEGAVVPRWVLARQGVGRLDQLAFTEPELQRVTS
jgi:dephospho-CoA kinase